MSSQLLRMRTHIYLGVSRDRSCCGLYVGFHRHLPAMTEADFRGRREEGTTAGVCVNCRRAFEKWERDQR